MKFFLISILFLNFSHIYGQSNEIILNERIPDQRFVKSEVALPLFRLIGDSIESEVTGEGKSHSYKIVFADMRGCLDTAYTYLFFNGIENNPLKGNVAVLIGNYNQILPMKLWIDVNCNLNFSDDGDPIELKKNFKYVDIALSNSKVPDGLLMNRLSLFNFKNNSSYYVMLDKYFKNLYPTRRFLGPTYCFREQQMRTVGRRMVIGNDSICIGLYDGNNNGLYTDIDEDEIVIGDYKSPVISTLEEDGAIVFTSQKVYTFVRRGVKYEVSNIDQAGRSLSLKTLDEKVLKGPELNKKIKFKFKNHKDQYVSLRKFRCKKVVLYFFDWSNPQLADDTVALNEINHKFGKKVKVVMLNYGGHPGLIKNYVQYGKIDYWCGISNKRINTQCKIDEFPSTIFLKKRRKVKLAHTSPSEILLLLNNKKI